MTASGAGSLISSKTALIMANEKGAITMEMLRDDPVIACMMRTGYPSWINDDYDEDEDEPEEELE